MEDYGGRKFSLVVGVGLLAFITVWVCVALKIPHDQFEKVLALFEFLKWLLGLYLSANVVKAGVDQIRK